MILKEIDSPSPRSCQLPRVPYWGVRHIAHLLFPCWNFVLAWICTGLVHAVLTSEIHMCNFPAVSRKHCFGIAISCLWLFYFPPFLLQRPLSLRRRGCDTDVSFKTQHSTVSYSLHRGQLWAFVLTTISFSWSNSDGCRKMY